MTYKIGTRVRKARGETNIGKTGVVVPIPEDRTSQLGDGWDMAVRIDGGWVSQYGNLKNSDTVAIVKSEYYDPIIPSGHTAGEEGHCEPLDKLLSEVREREAV